MNYLKIKQGDILEIINGSIYVNFIYVGTIASTGLVLSVFGGYNENIN